MTDRNEALRLADSIHEMNNAAYMTAIANLNEKNRQQAERIAELEWEIANLHTTMFAAAVEIQAHWEAHCDAEGYGPANLMHRLERGIASQYGYDAKTLQRVEAERDQLKTDLHIATDDAAQMLASTQSLRSERDQLRAEVERYRHLRNGQSWPAVFASHDAPEPLRGDDLDTALDHARTTHKDPA